MESVNARQVFITKLLDSPLAPYGALAIGIICTAFGPILLRWSMAPGHVAGFYRMVIASAVLLIPVFLRVKSKGWPLISGLKLSASAGVASGFDTLLWATGVMLSGATNPTLLANTAPVWVGLGALIIFRERLRLAFWAGLVIMLMGTATIVGLDTLKSETIGFGTFLGLPASIFFAAFLLISQRARNRVDSVTHNLIVSVTGAVLLLVVTIVLRSPLTGYSLQTYLCFIALGLSSQVLGWLMMIFALGHLPASIVAPTLLIQPILTALLAIPLLGESLTGGQIIGGVLILGGVLIVHISRAQSRA